MLGLRILGKTAEHLLTPVYFKLGQIQELKSKKKKKQSSMPLKRLIVVKSRKLELTNS